MTLLLYAALLYFGIGVLLTAFCVHMSYHEAAIGFGDSDDFKAQKVLESKMGLIGVLFLFAFWPIAILMAFRGKQPSEVPAADPETPKDTGDQPPSSL